MNISRGTENAITVFNQNKKMVNAIENIVHRNNKFIEKRNLTLKNLYSESNRLSNSYSKKIRDLIKNENKSLINRILLKKPVQTVEDFYKQENIRKKFMKIKCEYPLILEEKLPKTNRVSSLGKYEYEFYASA